jgi:hypothetical protein
MKAPNPPANRFDSHGLFGAARRAAAFASRPGGPRSRARRAIAVCLLFGLLLGQASAAVAVANARTHAPKPAARKSTKAAQPAAGRKHADAAAKAGSGAGKDGAAASAQPSPAPIAIEPLEASDVFAYPSDGGLKKYAVIVRWKDGKFFPTDPSLVSLSLTPAGATDVTIRHVTATRIEADFWAPDKFQVNDASVTVYDSKNRQLVVASSDVPSHAQGEEAGAADGTASLKTSAARASALEAPKPAEDEEPKINSTTVVFLQRAYGIGRLKIEGEHFGNYKAPPISAEDYLLCFEPLAQQALIDALSGLPKQTLDSRKALDEQRCKGIGSAELSRWNAWRADVEPRVKVALVPRNTDLRIEQTKILYIDDKLIDVYFEFNRYYNYSEPLRLASTTVTVKRDKKPAAGEQAETAARAPLASGGGHAASDPIGVAVAAGGAEAEDPVKCVKSNPNDCATFLATKEVGTKQDENLEYRYTVLDVNSAATLFGSGVAKNFYAIQLSVTNKGEKKIAVPLASIQAEIEWADGYEEEETAAGADLVASSVNPDAWNAPPPVPAKGKGDGANKGKGIGYTYFEEGPATISPLPLPAVTAYFDGDEKVHGKKARLFNVFDGAAILGSSLIPFFGPGFKDAHVAFTGGLVPGIRRSLGDLSGQQLQNLTALSWQGVEVVAAKGGSIDKFIFIQRGDQDFATGIGEKIKKRIKNIEGMEVVGFEVLESEAKRATLAGEQ